MNRYDGTIINNLTNEIVEHETVSDLEVATSVMKKVRFLKNLIEENSRVANLEIYKIKEWEDSENRDLIDKMKHYENILIEYFKQEIEKNPKFKLSTPYGKVTKRANTKWIYDEDEIVQYLEENNITSLITINKSIKKAEIKKLYPNGVDIETGEVISGITILNENSYSIKI